MRAIAQRNTRAVRGDVLGGLTVAAYLIPQVLAYAGVAGLPPVTGLWAAAGALGIYALLGSSRQLSVGPESTTALMTATALAPFAVGDPARYAALAAGLALAVGLVCVLARLARLGFLADLLSRPILVGYLAGVSAIMIVGQLANVTGVSVSGTGVIDEVRSFLGGLDRLHLPTLLFAAVVLVLLLVASRLVPRAPIPLIAVLLAAAVVQLFGLTAFGIATSGAVPNGLPPLQVPDLSAEDFVALLLPSVGVAVVGYSDAVVTGRAFAGRNVGQRVDANRELLALGGANVAAGFVGGFPVSSSGSRTVIGDASGARSQLHSLVVLAAVLVVLLVGGGVLGALPRAALGALVVYAAIRLIDVAEFRRIARFRKTELVLALAATAAVLVFGVLYGVLVAIGLSLLELLRRISRPHSAVLGFAPGIAGMHDIEDYPGSVQVPGLVVHRYDAPLYFANADDYRRSVDEAIEDVTPPGGEHGPAAEGPPAPPRWLLLDLEAVTEIDVTAADMLRELCAEMHRRGTVVALARTKQELLADLRAGGVLEMIGQERAYPTLPTAVAAYRAEYPDVA